MVWQTFRFALQNTTVRVWLGHDIMNNLTTVFIDSESDVVIARMEARQVAKKMGFGTVDQARISLATSELSRLIYETPSQVGEIAISDVSQSKPYGIQVSCCIDVVAHLAPDDPERPGVMLSEQMKFQRTLMGMARLMDECLLDVHENGKTGVTLIKWV